MKVLIAGLTLVVLAFGANIPEFTKVSSNQIPDLDELEKPLELDIPIRKTIKLPELLAANLIQQLQQNLGNERALTATINEYVDKVLVNVKDFIIHNGLDPVEMPDIHEGFEYKPLWITYHGELDLTRGWLQDLSTIYRLGDANVAYENKILTIALPLAFKDLQFDYQYSAKLMNLGPKGGIDGNVKEIRLSIVVDIDMENFQITMTRFQVTNTGKISIKFTGNVLTDWLANLFTNVLTTVLHNTVLKIVTNIIGDNLQDVIAEINKIIAEALKPGTNPVYYLH